MPFQCLPNSKIDVPLKDLSHLYNHADPRAYYKMALQLNYKTPRYVQEVAKKCCMNIQIQANLSKTWILDIGCGFAVNAAGLKHRIDPLDLYAYYHRSTFSNQSINSLYASDRHYFNGLKKTSLCIAGIEVASNALNYGLKTGLLDEGFCIDLSKTSPCEKLTSILNQCQVIIESGTPIEVLPYVIDNLLANCTADVKPKIVTAPPCFADISVYKEILKKHDYILEPFSKGNLPHRLFASKQEKANVLRAEQNQGLTINRGKLENYILATLYIGHHRDDTISFT